MILGIGCDIVRVERVERAAKNERFLIRVYTEAERTYAVQCGRAGAARFCMVHSARPRCIFMGTSRHVQRRWA